MAPKQKWPHLEALIDTWSGTKAKAFLNSPAPVPLPSSGPLHKLLVRTKKLLSTILVCLKDKRAAEEAVTLEAVAIISKLIGWLQQHPCHDIYSPSHDSRALWLLLVTTLDGIVSCLYAFRVEVGCGLLGKCIEQADCEGGKLTEHLLMAPISSSMDLLVHAFYGTPKQHHCSSR